MKPRYVVCNSFARARVVGAKAGDSQLYDVRVTGTVDDSAVVTMAGQEVASNGSGAGVAIDGAFRGVSYGIRKRIKPIFFR